MKKYFLVATLMFSMSAFLNTTNAAPQKPAWIILQMPDGTKQYLPGDATDEEINEVYDDWDREHGR